MPPIAHGFEQIIINTLNGERTKGNLVYSRENAKKAPK
jgi:hypothetical protein